MSPVCSGPGWMVCQPIMPCQMDYRAEAVLVEARETASITTEVYSSLLPNLRQRFEAVVDGTGNRGISWSADRFHCNSSSIQ